MFGKENNALELAREHHIMTKAEFGSPCITLPALSEPMVRRETTLSKTIGHMIWVQPTRGMLVTYYR